MVKSVCLFPERPDSGTPYSSELKTYVWSELDDHSPARSAFQVELPHPACPSLPTRRRWFTFPQVSNARDKLPVIWPRCNHIRAPIDDPERFVSQIAIRRFSPDGSPTPSPREPRSQQDYVRRNSYSWRTGASLGSFSRTSGEPGSAEPERPVGLRCVGSRLLNCIAREQAADSEPGGPGEYTFAVPALITSGIQGSQELHFI